MYTHTANVCPFSSSASACSVHVILLNSCLDNLQLFAMEQKTLFVVTVVDHTAERLKRTEWMQFRSGVVVILLVFPPPAPFLVFVISMREKKYAEMLRYWDKNAVVDTQNKQRKKNEVEILLVRLQWNHLNQLWKASQIYKAGSSSLKVEKARERENKKTAHRNQNLI